MMCFDFNRENIRIRRDSIVTYIINYLISKDVFYVLFSALYEVD